MLTKKGLRNVGLGLLALFGVICIIIMVAGVIIAIVHAVQGDWSDLATLGLIVGAGILAFVGLTLFDHWFSKLPEDRP